MKKLITAISLMSFGWSFAQNSEFLGYVTPSETQMVPAEAKLTNPKHQVIKPNFKGRELIEVDNSNTHKPDWVWQQHAVELQKATTATILWSKDGLGAGISPPDPTGDADSTVVIGSTNSSGGAVYRIFNKTNGATIGSNSYTMQSLGGAAGAGDPVVLYYKPAKRWFLTEFSSSGNKLLVYVSKTSNPQGAYWYYSFTCPNFPDYPKYAFSTSSDALLVTINDGPAVCAMKLSTMLTGAATSIIRTTIAPLNGFGFQSITPVDLEGDNAAPTGMKPLFIRHRDDESHNASTANATQDYLELWEMTINWTNNTATTTKIQDIAISEFDSKLCGLSSFACIKQPGGGTSASSNTLDPLREPVMYKAPMRVFSDHQTLLAAFSTDVDGSDRAGVRWVELRRSSGVTTATWTKYQEGTYAPGTGTSRWMPAINMDKYGNILLVYSTSSTNAGDYPSLKMTGRKPCDPLGQMTMTETTVVAGTTSKLGGSGDTRWGDYHQLSIDDFDGVTFYHFGLYQTGSSNANGTRSRSSAIRFDPSAKDAAIVNVFPVSSGAACGSSTQIGVIIENQGSSPITSGTFTWQVGTGATTNQTYASTQLSAGARDTIFVTITGLATGSNTVTITSTTVNGQNPDDNTCNDVYTATITSGSGSSFSVNSTVNSQPSCSSSNGSVTLSATGGTSPYTYSVNNGTAQSSATFTGLAAGNYTYSITDATGCSSSGTFALTSSTGNLTAAGTISSPILCNGQTATVTVAATGGQSGYTYSINGTTYQASNSFMNVAAGSYTVYAKDANGCIAQSTIIVTQPTAIALNVIPTMVTCNGSNNGSLSATATGGTAPFMYSIDGTNFYSQSVVNNLAPGSYTVTAKDANGCTKTFNTTITQPTSISVSGVSTSSTGADGTITLSGAGGLTPYTYSINGTSYTASSLFSNLAPGTYTCYIKDNNGCISITTVTVDQNVGLEDLNGTLQGVKLYPNPNNGVFELVVDGVAGEAVDCKLFNVNGQEVSSFKLTATNGTAQKTIEMSRKLAVGTYYLGIYNNNKACIKKFIRE